jgi:peptidoglycan/xylan/chitin deacetylase (PgdA/CDA1 family)
MILLIKKITTVLGIKRFVSHTYRSLYTSFDQLHRLTIKVFFRRKAVVLVYHRITEIDNDPLSLAVTPSNFQSHLEMLKNHFEVISITELTTRLINGTLKGRECSITFDDGYTDNLKEALPIATLHNVPITIFVSTGIFDNPTPFYWDQIYKNKAGTYLTKDQLKGAVSNLLTIGSHTVHHPRLIDERTERQYSEILNAKKELEHILNRNIEYFAYPFGGHFDYNHKTIKQVIRTGHKAAFTTSERAITRYTNIFRIPRINIRNQSSEELIALINKSL